MTHHSHNISRLADEGGLPSRMVTKPLTVRPTETILTKYSVSHVGVSHGPKKRRPSQRCCANPGCSDVALRRTWFSWYHAERYRHGSRGFPGPDRPQLRHKRSIACDL